MKQIFLTTIAAIAIISLAACKEKTKEVAGGPAPAAADFSNADQKYNTVVEKDTAVKWRGTKLTGEHTGELSVKSAALGVDKDGKVVGGNIAIDMTSITNDDVTDPEDKAKLVGHLKSDDFFDVANHPTAKFEVTSINGEQVTGNLVIKGKSHPVTMNAKVATEGDKATVNAKFTFDRSKYDVKYGSKTFFPNIGDKIIHNDVEVTVQLALAR